MNTPVQGSNILNSDDNRQARAGVSVKLGDLLTDKQRESLQKQTQAMADKYKKIEEDAAAANRKNAVTEEDVTEQIKIASTNYVDTKQGFLEEIELSKEEVLNESKAFIIKAMDVIDKRKDAGDYVNQLTSKIIQTLGDRINILDEMKTTLQQLDPVFPRVSYAEQLQNNLTVLNKYTSAYTAELNKLFDPKISLNEQRQLMKEVNDLYFSELNQELSGSGRDVVRAADQLQESLNILKSFQN